MNVTNHTMSQNLQPTAHSCKCQKKERCSMISHVNIYTFQLLEISTKRDSKSIIISSPQRTFHTHHSFIWVSIFSYKGKNIIFAFLSPLSHLSKSGLIVHTSKNSTSIKLHFMLTCACLILL